MTRKNYHPSEVRKYLRPIANDDGKLAVSHIRLLLMAKKTSPVNVEGNPIHTDSNIRWIEDQGLVYITKIGGFIEMAFSQREVNNAAQKAIEDAKAALDVLAPNHRRNMKLDLYTSIRLAQLCTTIAPEDFFPVKVGDTADVPWYGHHASAETIVYEGGYEIFGEVEQTFAEPGIAIYTEFFSSHCAVKFTRPSFLFTAGKPHFSPAYRYMYIAT